MKFVAPCIKVTFADGVRNVVLRYDLRDTAYPLRVTLRYRELKDFESTVRRIRRV